MKLIQVRAPDFDLAMTFDSGQVFHWEKVGAGFIGTIEELPVYIEQDGEILRANVASASSRCLEIHAQDAHATIRRYFALDHPLEEIYASFPNDPVMNAAKEFCRGLRVIRQPKWECLATFICSSMKQVAHIRQISRKLRERFGETQQVDNYIVHIFPSAARISASSERELRKCGLGYRANTLLATARLVASGDVDLEKLSILTDVDLRARLCELQGVGAKVANCVMLFAYERLRAFPIDVWIERVLREKYFPRARKLNAGRLRAFTERYFGDHGGYAQQYLFHHARMSKALEGRALSRPKKFRTTRMSSLHDKGASIR